jgi:hypothetical protein
MDSNVSTGRQPGQRGDGVSALLVVFSAVALAALLVSCCLAAVVKDWRAQATVAFLVSGLACAELIVLACLVVVYRAWPGRRPTGVARAGFWVGATPVAAVVPAGGVRLLVGGDDWSALALPGVGVAVAVLAALVAAEIRRRRASDRLPAVALWVVLPMVVLVCGGSAVAFVRYIDGRDPLGDKGIPFVAPSERPVPVPSWSPAADGGFLAKLRHDLETAVLTAAGEPGETTSECSPHNATFDKPDVFPCQVVYRGARATFTVTIQSSTLVVDGRLNWIRYEVKAEEVILTRYLIERRIADQFNVAETPVRCEPLPELTVVAVGTTLPPSCYVEREWHGGHRTYRIMIKATASRESPSVDLVEANE